MTARLAASALGHWEELDGFALAHQMPPLAELPLDRFCNFVYWRITDGAEAPELAKFRAQLWMPPRGVEPDKRSPWSPDNELAALQAFKKQVSNATGGEAPVV